MITLIIARHGNTFNPGDTVTRVGARTDLPLVPSGIAQAQKLGQHLKERNLLPDITYCSGLMRTRQTAQIALDTAGLTQTPQALEIFNEIDYGVDENKPESEVIARIGEKALRDWEEHTIAPQGWLVNIDEIKSNINIFLNNITKKNKENKKTILVVTSNGIARFFPILSNTETPITSLKLGTGCYGILSLDKNTWSVKEWGIKPQ